MSSLTKKIIAICIIVLLLVGGLYFYYQKNNPTGMFSTLGITKITMTENENNGIQEILARYGGDAKVHYTVPLSGNTAKSGQYFQIELIDSFIIEEFLNEDVTLVMSNIAYLFIKNLGEEKTNYQIIKVTLTFKHGIKSIQKSKEFMVDDPRFLLMDKKIVFVDKIMNLLKDKNYNALKLMLSPLISDTDKDLTISAITQHEIDYSGDREAPFALYGFGFVTLKHETNIPALFVILLRGEHFLGIGLTPDDSKDEILSLDYNF